LKQVIRTYTGRNDEPIEAFKADAVKLAARGYYPRSQVWVPGSYGAGEFILALLLCIILIGFLILAYMLVVAPGGALVVTYTSVTPQGDVASEVSETPIHDHVYERGTD
jgi:zinc transporter ZupT